MRNAIVFPGAAALTLALLGCAPTQSAAMSKPATTAAPAAAPATADAMPASASMIFASYDAAPAMTSVQGGNVYRYAYSEKPGDGKAAELVKSPAALTLSYSLARANGSSYAGAAIAIDGKADNDGNPDNPAPATDLGGYTKLRIELAAKGTGKLQVKLTGNDPVTTNNGCYPVRLVDVTPALTAYTLDISSFKSRDYCGGNARAVASVLPNLVRVEIEDNDLTGAPKSAQMMVGKVEFVK